MQISSIVFLLLFAISTLFVYVAVRRGWLPLVTAGIAGSLANSVFFGLFSISQNNGPAHAVIVGLVFGVLFTVMTLIIAVYFKSHAPLAHPEPPSSDAGLT